MYIYIYIYVKFTYILHTHTHTHTHTYIYIYICVCVCVCVHMYIKIDLMAYNILILYKLLEIEKIKKNLCLSSQIKKHRVLHNKITDTYKLDNRDILKQISNNTA